MRYTCVYNTPFQLQSRLGKSNFDVRLELLRLRMPLGFFLEVVLLDYQTWVHFLVLLDVSWGWRTCKQGRAQSFWDDAWTVEERVVLYFVDVKAFGGVRHKNARDQVFGHGINKDMAWKLEGEVLDPRVGFFDILAFERRLAIKECINNYSKGPDIHLKRVAFLSFENLRSDVVWRATDCALLLPDKVELCCEAKVSNLYLHIVVNEKVCQLKVTMDYFVLLKVFDSLTYLPCIALDLKLMQPLSPLDQLTECFVLAER